MLVAQKASDTINFKTFNPTLLESLVLDEINALRKRSDLQALVAHDKLYLAAEDQAKFIVQLGKLTHEQPITQKATVKERIGIYGGKMRGMAENAAGFTIKRPAKFKNTPNPDTIMTVQTYAEAAYGLVRVWRLSTVHYTNMMYPKFNLCGLCIRVDEKTSMLYAVHVFGYE